MSKTLTLPDLLREVQNMPENSRAAREAILAAWGTRTKPPGSLGRLETIAIWMGAVQQTESPRVERRCLRLYGGAHGVTEEGVSLCPNHINEQMMRNFRNGGGAINVLCRSNGIHFQSIDLGMDNPTQNFLKGPAMSEEEMWEALRIGWESVPTMADLFAVGEMGIGNTTPSTAIIAAMIGADVDAITGRGAGLTDERLLRKIEVIQTGIELHRDTLSSPLRTLAALGGREIAAMTGAILSAACKNIPIVLDGVIAAAAAAVAFELQPLTVEKCIAGHRGAEPAQRAFLQHYGLEPLVDLEMRLGEGSGAAVAMSIVRNAVDCFNQMATFEQAGVQL